MSHIVIIGNGIAGITTARHIRKHSEHEITVISGETDHFFSRTALMYIYMGHMKFENTKPYEDWFWAKNKINLRNGWVKNIDFEGKQVQFDSGGNLRYDKLVLATGSSPNKFGWPGQDLKGVTGLYSYQNLQYMESHTDGINHAVVVGGGLIGVEMVEMLLSRGITTTFLVREKIFWDVVLPEEEAKLIGRHIEKHHVDLRLDTELKEILSDENGNANAVITSKGDKIDCQFVGLTAGVHPNISFLNNSILEIDRGILVNDLLETNVPDVYAAGDCAQVRTPLAHRRPIEAVWYVGRMMGEALGQTLAGIETPYHPGVWFNSAKFFDIEYQTYGKVSPQLLENEEQFYWEAPDGMKCVKIVFEKGSRKVIGVNTLGIRMRHEVWNDWLQCEKQIDQIISDLHLANFDPEFFKQYESEIQLKYNEVYPNNKVTIRKPTFLSRLLS